MGMKRKRAKFNLHMAVTMAEKAESKARIDACKEWAEAKVGSSLAAADVHTVTSIVREERKKAAELLESSHSDLSLAKSSDQHLRRATELIDGKQEQLRMWHASTHAGEGTDAWSTLWRQLWDESRQMLETSK